MEDENKLVVPFVSFFKSTAVDEEGHPLPFEVVVENASFDALVLAQGSIPKSNCPPFLFVELFVAASVFPKISVKKIDILKFLAFLNYIVNYFLLVEEFSK